MKDDYFEICFSNKKFILPVIYSSINIDMLRIGKSKDGELLIRKLEENGGNILILAGGGGGEYSCLFSYAKEYKNYIPIKENGLWGYAESLGKILISPKYDFATIFERDVARVKLNNKWGLINKQGEEITPIKYDYISLIDSLQLVYKKLGGMDLPIDNNKTEKLYSPPLFRVSIGGKHGVLDINGNETIPVIYDEIGYLSAEGFTHIRLGDKWGFAIGAKVVIPAIYSEILYSVSPNQETVKRDGKYYIVDKDGYEYETKKRGVAKKGFFFNPDTYLSPILSTKRKIQLDEQKIE
jgi:hypothetical protein